MSIAVLPYTVKPHPVTGVYSGKLGTWLFLASEVMLFGALFTGTSSRNLDPTVFPPDLATNLSRIIQGLVVLFVGADLLILYLWNARRKVGLVRRAKATEA